MCLPANLPKLKQMEERDIFEEIFGTASGFYHCCICFAFIGIEGL
jgi:hypothetical protein